VISLDSTIKLSIKVIHLFWLPIERKLFCGENVETILGYTVDQVMGLGYWKLTEDTEFYGEEYHTSS
jgi:hypothetical protein